MRLRMLALVLVVIGVQAAYLRHVEQSHRTLLDTELGVLEHRVRDLETLTTRQLSPAGGWRRDVKRRLKRLERCCCAERTP